MSDGWQLGASVVVAAFASGVCVVVLNRYRPRRMVVRGDALCLCSVLAGAILGHAVLDLWPHWPPANALDRFLVIGLPATVMLLLCNGSLRESYSVHILVYTLFALGLVRLLLHRSIYLQGNAAATVALVAGSASLLILVNRLLMRQWLRTRRASIPFALAATLFAAGLLVAMAGYIKGGTVALPWSAAVAGTTIAACWIGARGDLQGVAGLAVVLLFGVLFIGRYFGAITTGSALILMVTPLSCWVTELPGIRDSTPWQKQCVYLSIVAVTIVVVLLMAKQTFDRDMAPLLGEVERATRVC